MTLPIERNSATSRRATLAKARLSRRPSRLGKAAGTAPEPDYPLSDDAGFPSLLNHAVDLAMAAPDVPSAVDALLTLGGHVPAHIQLRALRMVDECALKVLCGRSWREEGQTGEPRQGGTNARPAFIGEFGLTTGGRMVVRVPSRGPLSSEDDLVGGVLRVPWSHQDLRCYQRQLSRLAARFTAAVADCRQWLAGAGPQGRHDILENLKEAAFRTAPFVLYQEDKRYTNFRERNTLTGKTLWPGHPDCALSSLSGVPLELWSDSDVVLVVCLTLLVRSAGFARIEEVNGTQLTIDHVAYLLEQARLKYNKVPGGGQVAPARSVSVTALADLAGALSAKRREISPSVQLYREIHGPLMHKIECVAAPAGPAARQRETRVCALVSEQLPVAGATLDELGLAVNESPEWLAKPHGEFGTGLESLIYETVRASTSAFDCDFAMSRGLRSLTALVAGLRAQEWTELIKWDLPHFYCCVVPVPQACRHFGDSLAQLADTAWAISSRMQYNSWHFLAGNLPKIPQVAARDYFVPPTIPDVAYYSDQHHHGHVAAKVRFSIRCPQTVEIAGRAFRGFVDLRLLRCAGQPFGEQDLLAAHRTSAFIAKATSVAAKLAADGEQVEITSFDSEWHWAKIAS
ncbi:MAG TPA: hypothetical protein VFQ44_09155 [Streptosporangiaceae bacterium]|nr:hypothetical protein [Streptosporangiaceae bacterium]